MFNKLERRWVENINIRLSTRAVGTNTRAVGSGTSTADTKHTDISTADAKHTDARAKLVGVKFSKSLYIFLFYYIMVSTRKNRGKKGGRLSRTMRGGGGYIIFKK